MSAGVQRACQAREGGRVQALRRCAGRAGARHVRTTGGGCEPVRARGWQRTASVTSHEQTAGNLAPLARCDVACEAAPPASAASFQSSRGERENEEEYEFGSEEYDGEYIDMDDEDDDEDDDDDGDRRPSSSSFDMQGSWLETAEQARRAYRDDISARFESAGSRPGHVRGEPPSVPRHNSRRASTGATAAPDAASVMAIVSPRLASSSSSSSSAAEIGPGTVVKSPYARFVAEARRSASVADILGAWESYKLERVLGESGQSQPPSSSARAGTAAAIAVHQVASMMRRNRERSVELEQMGRGHEMTELVAEALADIESCPAERVVRLVWSMSVMGGSYSFASEDLESIISRKLFRNEKKGRYLLSRLRVEHLKDLAWSLGQFRYRDAEFMGAIMSCFEHKIDRANPRMCASVLWACAVTNVQPPASLLEKIVGRWDLDSWNSFSLCNSVWALAVLGLEGSVAFAALWNHMAGIAQSGQLDLLMGGAKNERAELLQIYQALIAIRGLDCEDDGTVRIGGELKEMPHDIQRKAAMFWARYLRRKSQHISSFQRDVAYTIGNLGYDPKIEDNEAGFAVDIALHLTRDMNLAIEIDGPTHLTCNTLEPTGKTLFKCRMLAATGWDVMSVPINEWDECETEDAKESYILNRLKPFLKRENAR